MDDHLLRQALYEQAQQEIPDHMNRWNEIQQKLPQMPASPLPKRRRAMARFIPLMMILLVSAGAYALYQSTVVFFPLDIICQEEGYHELGISQTVDGVTVHLERAYADTSVVTFIIRVEGVPYEQYSKQLFRTGAGTLTDEQGTTFNLGYHPDSIPCPFDITKAGTRPPDEEILSVISTGGLATTTAPFYMSLSDYFETTYAGTPETLDLSYELTLQTAKPTPTPANPEGTAEPQPAEYEERVFRFDFTVPVHGEILLEPNQTVEKDGFAVTLTQARIGKSVTQIQLCYPELVATASLYEFPITLTIGEYEGWQHNSVWNKSASSETRWCFDYTYNMYFEQSPAILTLQIEDIYTPLDTSFETTEQWKELIALAAEQGIEVELHEDGDFIFPQERPTDKFTGENPGETMLELYAQTGLMDKYEGPWIFTVEIPESEAL